ncbi:MAG: hypothetical protein ACI3Y0_03940 [Prevotella sp.]
MKFLTQQTDSEGKTIYIERVAKCTPQGGLSMISDVFEEATCEQQFDVDYMKEGKDKMVACLQFADYCIDCGVYDKALHYYTYVLRESVSDGGIIKEYYNLADRAYQGVACCSSCDDEYTWELSSDILEKYRDLFNDKNEN